MQKIQDFRLLSSIEGLCLLALMNGEMCGYEITAYIKKELGEIVAHPLVYRKLFLLTQHGYTERLTRNIKRKDKGKVNYKITEKGIDWLIEKRRPIMAAYALVKDIT
jgi:DNA-binding PadR family transcriptional regulator